MDLPDTISDLDKRFGTPGLARVVAGNGGLPKVTVSTQIAVGEMYLHGGHITSWVPNGSGELFYVSPNSIWKGGHAIRGGVPISFPWFADKGGDRTAPPHGFVRTKAWHLSSIESTGSDVVVSMSTESDEDTRKWWPLDFRLVCQATFGIQLKIELVVTNTSLGSFSFEEALHSYFKVGHAETAIVQGLDSTRYIDKTDGRIEKKQIGEARISSETDRVYLNTQHEVELVDPTLQRRVTVRKENSLTTVVWNPWAEQSRVISDLGATEWRNFVCIETSNVSPFAVHLDPGQRHTLAARIQVAPWPATSSSATSRV